MSLGKQAKTLNKKQIDQLLLYVGTLQHAQRNEIVVLRSVRAGLRAKEIAELQWAMLTDAEENIGSSIQLTDKASKGAWRSRYTFEPATTPETGRFVRE